MGQPAGEVSATRLGERAAPPGARRRTRRSTTWRRGSRSSSPRAPAARPRSTCARSDYVNMGLARHADLPVVVVGDIDRGGVFAAFVGTLALLDDGRRSGWSPGFVVNKFRGDARPAAARARRARAAHRAAGVRRAAVAPRPVARLRGRARPRGPAVRAAAPGEVAVVRLPRISNFTDVDALGLEPDLDVVFASTPRGLADADLVVLPGTRATIADLAWLRERGLDRAVARPRGGRPAGARDLRRLPDARPRRSPTRTASRGRRRPWPTGWGCSTSPRSSPPRRCCAATSRPATRSTTAGSPAR